MHLDCLLQFHLLHINIECLHNFFKNLNEMKLIIFNTVYSIFLFFRTKKGWLYKKIRHVSDFIVQFFFFHFQSFSLTVFSSKSTIKFKFILLQFWKNLLALFPALSDWYSFNCSAVGSGQVTTCHFGFTCCLYFLLSVTTLNVFCPGQINWMGVLLLM